MASPPLADFAVPVRCVPAAVRDDPRGFRAGGFEAAELERLAERLAERGPAALAALPLDRRLEIWCDVVEALSDPADEERRRLLPALLATARLSPEGLVEGLRILLDGVDHGAAERLAARVRSPGPRPLGAVVLAGNLPALAVQSLLPAFLLGRPLLLKSASDEPLFAPALVAALVRREPSLADAYAAVRFVGADEARGTAALGRVERVIAYGGAEAIGALATRLGGRLVAFGPKASVALVGGDIDPVGVGRALARDVALFDQRGCLSLHAVYAEGSEQAAEALAEGLAWGLALEHGRLPPGPIDPRAAAHVQQLRGEAELAGRAVGRLELPQGTVVRAPEPGFRPSPGLRFVRVHRVARLVDSHAPLARERGRLQGAALAGEAAWALAPELAALGIARCAPAGSLQAVDAAWANGGLDPLEVFG